MTGYVYTHLLHKTHKNLLIIYWTHFDKRKAVITMMSVLFKQITHSKKKVHPTHVPLTFLKIRYNGYFAILGYKRIGRVKVPAQIISSAASLLSSACIKKEWWHTNLFDWNKKNQKSVDVYASDKIRHTHEYD